MSKAFIFAKGGKLKELVQCIESEGIFDLNEQDDDGRTLFHWAITHGSEDVARLLVDKGASVDSVDEGGITPLMSACSIGLESNVDMIIGLSKAPLDQKHSSAHNKTALFTAISKGKFLIAKKLLQKGASPSIPDSSLQTPLHRAVIRGSLEMCELLLLHKADVNAQDRVGDTPLHYASMENNKELGCFLIQNGADKEIQNKEGKYYYDL
eukprot:TRINITY_DN1544_c0_g1_i2.p2 TRINITY_DN1544_c0_g1~~TRINITY_DN1544_c0_g1_i2.p2  ORF type:complete len:210 (+),score=51.62 TRINITY_DN1544_c0_g1_i2:44-673(+)